MRASGGFVGALGGGAWAPTCGEDSEIRGGSALVRAELSECRGCELEMDISFRHDGCGTIGMESAGGKRNAAGDGFEPSSLNPRCLTSSCSSDRADGACAAKVHDV